MNRPQKLTLVFFIFIALLIGAFPPWRYDIGELHRSIGLHFLFTDQHISNEPTVKPIPAKSSPSAIIPPENDQHSSPTKENRPYDPYSKENLKRVLETTAPEPLIPMRFEPHIDVTKLTVEWVTLGMVTVGLLFVLKTSN